MKNKNNFVFIIFIVVVCFFTLSFSVKAEAYANTNDYTNIILVAKSNGLSPEDIFGIDGDGIIECTETLKNTMPILQDIFKYIRIASVVLFVVLSSADYVKAISASDQSIFKKANSTTLKRLIGVIGIMILPALVNLILAIVQFSNGTCGIN